MPCDTDHFYAHCGDDAPDDSEQHDKLRTIIVFHAELLQYQEEVIADRERQIEELRIQRDELQERLRRLEVCVAHVACQTEEPFVDARTTLLANELLPREARSAALAPSVEEFEVTRCEIQEVPIVPEEETAVQEHRGHSPLPKATADRPPAAEPTRVEDALVQNQLQAEPVPPRPPRGPPPAAEDEERAQEAPAEGPAAPTESSSQEAAAPPEPSSARNAARKRSVAAHEEPGRLFNNNQAYATAACAAGPPPSSEEAAAEAIEVPKWRENPVASLYSMEGTENLDDEIFRKRHAKPEANEKRRKRWDLRLLREQERTERLRRRMERRTEKPPTCPPTFCGDLEQIHTVEVVDEIPVQAFGQAIPELQPQEFQLPWEKWHDETAKKPKRPRRKLKGLKH
nr:male-specific lethal 1 homolog [Rhipicephalus microplus]